MPEPADPFDRCLRACEARTRPLAEILGDHPSVRDQLLDALQQLVGEISCTIPLGEGGQPYMTTLHVDIDGDEQPELTPEAWRDREGAARPHEAYERLLVEPDGRALKIFRPGAARHRARGFIAWTGSPIR